MWIELVRHRWSLRMGGGLQVGHIYVVSLMVASGVVVDGKLTLCGGWLDTEDVIYWTKRCFSMDPETGEWIRFPRLDHHCPRAYLLVGTH